MTLDPSSAACVKCAQSDRIEYLSQDVRRLKRLVAQLQDDLKSGLCEIRGRLEESARGAAEQTAGLIERILKAEQHQKTQDDAADAIAAQMTTLGLELATWPTAPTLHAALDRLERLAATACARQGEPREWDEQQLGSWIVRLGLPESV